MNVTVYTADKCMQCHATKKQLDHVGIPFREVNVDEDDAARDTVTALGYSSAPVVIVEGATGVEHWSGYRPDRIIALKKDRVNA